jgi:CDP-diacylglycerol--glycerol-3-phosphate 3-phosphatidyltransferase
MSKPVSKFLKNLPNALSLARLILCVAAPIIGIFTDGTRDAAYWVVVSIFLFGIVSDIADGYIARRFNICTRFGANLDAIADYLLVLAVAVFAFFQVRIFDGVDRTMSIVAGICVGVLFVWKLLAIGITKLKFGQFNSMHTYFNKAIGGFIMISAMTFILMLEVVLPVLWIMFGAIFIAFSEEIILVLHDKVYNVNRKGFLFDKALKKEENRE